LTYVFSAILSLLFRHFFKLQIIVNAFAIFWVTGFGSGGTTQSERMVSERSRVSRIDINPQRQAKPFNEQTSSTGHPLSDHLSKTKVDYLPQQSSFPEDVVLHVTPEESNVADPKPAPSIFQSLTGIFRKSKRKTPSIQVHSISLRPSWGFHVNPFILRTGYCHDRI